MDNVGIGTMLGTPIELHALGQVWTVEPPNQFAKDRLEKLVARAALENVRQLKDVLDPTAYQETFKQAIAGIPDTKTWRPLWVATVFSAEGSILFLWSLLQQHHPGITEKQVSLIAEEAPEEVAAALAQLMPDFFQQLLEPVKKRLPGESLVKVEAAIQQLRDRLKPTPTSSK